MLLESTSKSSPPKSRQSRAPRYGSRIIAQPVSGEETPEGRDNSKQGQALSVGQTNLNKNGKRPPLTVEWTHRGLSAHENLSGAECVAQPLHSIPSPKENQVSLQQMAYRAFWTGVLPEERIEEECHQIEKL